MTIPEFITYLIFGLILGAAIVSALLLIKLPIAFINSVIIIDAICKFKLDRVKADDLVHVRDVEYKDMEAFEDTIFRLTDWGYKRILPKEKYKLIKPFIDRKGSKRNAIKWLRKFRNE